LQTESEAGRHGLVEYIRYNPWTSVTHWRYF
jgi:hypothetical protein